MSVKGVKKRVKGGRNQKECEKQHLRGFLRVEQHTHTGSPPPCSYLYNQQRPFFVSCDTTDFLGSARQAASINRTHGRQPVVKRARLQPRGLEEQTTARWHAVTRAIVSSDSTTPCILKSERGSLISQDPESPPGMPKSSPTRPSGFARSPSLCLTWARQGGTRLVAPLVLLLGNRETPADRGRSFTNWSYSGSNPRTGPH